MPMPGHGLGGTGPGVAHGSLQVMRDLLVASRPPELAWGLHNRPRFAWPTAFKNGRLKPSGLKATPVGVCLSRRSTRSWFCCSFLLLRATFYKSASLYARISTI